MANADLRYKLREFILAMDGWDNNMTEEEIEESTSTLINIIKNELLEIIKEKLVSDSLYRWALKQPLPTRVVNSLGRWESSHGGTLEKLGILAGQTDFNKKWKNTGLMKIEGIKYTYARNIYDLIFHK